MHCTFLLLIILNFFQQPTHTFRIVNIQNFPIYSIIEKSQNSEEFQNASDLREKLANNPEAKAIIAASDKKFQAFLNSDPEAKSYIDAVSKISESGILDSKEMKRLKYYENKAVEASEELEKLPIEYADVFAAEKLKQDAQIKHDKLV